MKKFQGTATQSTKYNGTLEKTVYVASNDVLSAESVLKSANKGWELSDIIEVETFPFDKK